MSQGKTIINWSLGLVKGWIKGTATQDAVIPGVLDH